MATLNGVGHIARLHAVARSTGREEGQVLYGQREQLVDLGRVHTCQLSQGESLLRALLRHAAMLKASLYAGITTVSEVFRGNVAASAVNRGARANTRCRPTCRIKRPKQAARAMPSRSRASVISNSEAPESPQDDR